MTFIQRICILVIGEANWLTLKKDIGILAGDGVIENKFDALICAGNSFAFLPDRGDLKEQKYGVNY